MKTFMNGIGYFYWGRTISMSTLDKLFKRIAHDKKKGPVLSRIAFFSYTGCLHTYPIQNNSVKRL